MLLLKVIGTFEGRFARTYGQEFWMGKRYSLINYGKARNKETQVRRSI